MDYRSLNYSSLLSNMRGNLFFNHQELGASLKTGMQSVYKNGLQLHKNQVVDHG